MIFFLLEETPMDASKKETMDEYYTKWAADLTREKASEITDTFKQTIQYLNSLNVDFEKYKINGVSHFYALFALAQHCSNAKIEAATITSKLDEFYDCLRNSDELGPDVKAYRESMQANTRSKGQRLKRINALIRYCGA